MNKIAHIHLEGPFIKAAKILLPEKPAGLGWYKNHWAFLFNGSPSKPVIEAARRTGFIIDKNNSQTIIAIPHIKEYEIKKATQKFDLFAKEYRDLSKKVESIIHKSINGEVQVIGSVMKKSAMSDLDKKKEDWVVDIKHQIKEIESYLGKIERTSFNLKTDRLGPNKESYYENDMTGDIQYHLNEIKEIFNKAKEEEEKSNRNAKKIKWSDYKKATALFD